MTGEPSGEEALRDRIAAKLPEAEKAAAVLFSFSTPYRHMADWIMPLIRGYRAEGERAAWVYYRDATVRESDARAEAAHKVGYEQGRRDALAPLIVPPLAVVPYVIDRHDVVWQVVRDGGMVARADWSGQQSAGIHWLETTAGPLTAFDPVRYKDALGLSPDPHPGGTNPVAARVGTDGPA